MRESRVRVPPGSFLPATTVLALITSIQQRGQDVPARDVVRRAEEAGQLGTDLELAVEALAVADRVDHQAHAAAHLEAGDELIADDHRVVRDDSQPVAGAVEKAD